MVYEINQLIKNILQIDIWIIENDKLQKQHRVLSSIILLSNNTPVYIIIYM